MKSIEDPIVVEQVYKASSDKAWAAITVKEKMTQWFFDNILEFKPEPGFETRFDISVEDRHFRHLWKVVEVIPKQKLSYEWRFEGYDGLGLSIFELFVEEPSSVRIKLNYSVLEDLSPPSTPQDIKKGKD